jgi:hypothetical protein
LAVPVTVALSAIESPVSIDVVCGVTETVTDVAGGVTVTVAVSLLVESAWLVATT